MKKIHKIGIGFVTGRKQFQRVLKTNIYNWLDGGLTANERLQLIPIITVKTAHKGVDDDWSPTEK
ncbi:hypothetical protein [Desulfitobacterium sp. AusDCA]|uniref:hypothetical protein n=1 Tax=Desulfitobacterium sp. AusDCA TaxID=3240383 RepID=UPI003DA790AD